MDPLSEIFMWNLHVEPLSGTIEPLYVDGWNHYVASLCVKQLWVEPWSGSFIWNRCGPWELRSVEPLYVEPLCGTSRSLVQGFGRLPQTPPKLYWKNPKLFKLLGKNLYLHLPTHPPIPKLTPTTLQLGIHILFFEKTSQRRIVRPQYPREAVQAEEPVAAYGFLSST